MADFITLATAVAEPSLADQAAQAGQTVLDYGRGFIDKFMENWAAYIVFGGIIGAVAKFLFPGRDPGGFIGTIVIGIIGMLLGTLVDTEVARAISGGDNNSLLGLLNIDMLNNAIPMPTITWSEIVVGIVGSMILLLVYRILFGEARR